MGRGLRPHIHHVRLTLPVKVGEIPRDRRAR
jgi:hypothetical protein